MKANTLLRTAATTLQKRGKDYGTMRENHQRIADIWTVIMQKEVTP